MRGVPLKEEYLSAASAQVVLGCLPAADAGRKTRRLLHTSDLHLESLGDGGCRSLEALVDLVLDSGVHLVLVVGDLFDHNRVGDDVVRFAVGELGRLSVPTVILPGNHDCLLPNSVYHRLELWRAAANVHILRDTEGETLALPGLGITLWGRAIDAYGGELRPLMGIPRDGGSNGWRIALAHGAYTAADPGYERSFPITPEDIAASGQDYVALGHSAAFSCVCSDPVKAYYSGSPSIVGTFAIADLVEGVGVEVTRCLVPGQAPA